MNHLKALVALTGIQVSTSFAATAVLTISPLLAMSLGISPKWIGVYTAILYAAAALSSIFFGNRVHLMGSFQVSRICLALCATAMLIISTSNIAAVLLGSIMMGLGYGGITPASSYFLSQIGPIKNRSLLFSIRQSGVPAGAALAAVVVPRLTNHLGISWAFIIPGAAAVIAAIAFRLKSSVDGMPTSSATREKSPIWSILETHPQIRILALIGFIFSGLQVTTIAMLVPYLHAFQAMSIDGAAQLLTIFNVIGVVFRLVWGRCVDRGLSALKMLGISGVLGAIGFVVMTWSAFGAVPPAALYLAAGTLGMAVIAWNGVLFSEIAAVVPKNKVGQATGLCVFSGFIGVVVMPTILTQSIESQKTSGCVFAIGTALSLFVSLLTLKQRKKVES